MKTVFLAEGETHVRAALRLTIEFQGRIAVVGEADHPESLLAQVCQNPPDVILLDWNLPGLHPQRLIRILGEHCPHTRVVATSVKPEHEKAAREYGVDGFLLKQLTPEAFIAGLEMAIGGWEL
jgi:DNA-binding NarL/FixJ family response regulator